MSNTSKSIAVILLLLIAAVIVGVCYSQGVFDALIPDDPGTDTPGGDTPGTDTPGGDTPGTDTPGDDTPGGNTDEPGTDEPGTDEPGTDTPGTDEPENPEIGTVVAYNESVTREDSIYLLAPDTQYVFSLAAFNESGEEIEDAQFSVDEDTLIRGSNYHGKVDRRTYIVHRDPSTWEFISEEWLDDSKESKFSPEQNEYNDHNITVKSISISGNNLIIQTGVALEETYIDLYPSYHGTIEYSGKYYETIEPCYISIPVYYQSGYGTVNVITTNAVEGEDQPLPDDQDEPTESDPEIPTIYHHLYFSDTDISNEDIEKLMEGAEVDGNEKISWIIKGGTLNYENIPTGIYIVYYSEIDTYMLALQEDGETEYLWASKDTDIISAGWAMKDRAIADQTVNWKSDNADILLKYVSFNVPFEK